MPEGPSILLHRDSLRPLLKGKKIISATGNAKIDTALIQGRTIKEVESWGKHLLICLPKHVIRIHFLMFGSFSIDEHVKQDRSLRLMLAVSKHTIYFYTCFVRILEGAAADIYDWEGDVLNQAWNAAKARKKIKATPEAMVCDVLLNQDIFAGVGNIIKNEVLYRIQLHPETRVGNLPPRLLTKLIEEARNYSFDFLRWKKEFVLRKHWLAHTKKTCHRCEIPMLKKYCGETKRRTFFCENCQRLYS